MVGGPTEPWRVRGECSPIPNKPVYSVTVDVIYLESVVHG